jgi:predicted methyltransferase
MPRNWVQAFVLGLALIAPAMAEKAPDAIAAAVADPGRPQSDVKRDTLRKPAEMLEFAGIKPGMKVMDMIPGGGYFTRLFAKAVGPTGFVYSFQPDEWDAYLKGRQPPINEVALSYPNVSVIKAPIDKLTAPEPLDLVWTSQNYHDLKNFKTVDTNVVDRAVFTALKPGGIFIVLDHSAPKGSGVSDTDTLHRIDEDVVKKEVTAAGFELIGESNALRNPADTRTLKVFDPQIRGHTDQFILKFRKPLH